MADKAKIQQNGKARFTFMAYMGGDNDLDGTALRDIEEMSLIGSTKDVNVPVQLDRPGDGQTGRFLSFGKQDREVAGTKGLSIYFPANSINPAYRGLDFTSDCRRASFLSRYPG